MDASIGGGISNQANAYYATVPGGYENTAAGASSFAAGNNAYADKDNCFVWSDGTGAAQQKCNVHASAVTDSFVVRATGGAQFVVAVDGSGNPLTYAYITAASNGWLNASDQKLKRDITEIDPREVLERLASMPVATWRFNIEGTSPLHMGPMAQDFYAAFKLGDDNTHISSMDETGVALAAIQGLHQESLRKDEVINALGTRVATLERVNSDAKDRVAALEKANADANSRVASLEQRLEQIEAQLRLRK